MSNFLKINTTLQNKLQNYSYYFVAYTFFLTLLSTLITKSFARISITLLLLASISLIATNKDKFKEVYTSSKLFFKLLLLLFATYTFIGLYHHGLSAELTYQFKKTRWILYALVILPTLVITIEHFKQNFTKLPYRALLIILQLIASIILFDVLLKYFFDLTFFSSIESIHHFKGRVSWTYNPNTFSRITLFFAYLFLFLSTQKLLNPYKWPLTIIGSLYFYLTLISFSRAIWVGILASIVFLLFKLMMLKRVKTMLLSFLIFAGCAFAFFSSTESFNRLASFKAIRSYAIQHRLQMWRANFAFVKKSPFIGVGYGENYKKSMLEPHFDKEFSEKYKYRSRYFFTSPHNEYVDVAAGYGLPALILFLTFFSFMLCDMFSKMTFSYKDSSILISFLFLVSCLVSFIFDGIGYSIWPVILFSLLPVLIKRYNDKNLTQS